MTRYLLILEDTGRSSVEVGRRLASVQKHAGKRGLRVLMNARDLPEGLSAAQVWERVTTNALAEVDRLRRELDDQEGD